jgi:hypothetical protein
VDIARPGTHADQLLLEEEERGGPGVVTGVLLLEAVALLEREEVPHVLPPRANGPDDLFCLALGHARIVLSLLHVERRLDPVRRGQRRDAVQDRAHVGLSLVAVLGPPEIPPVRLRVLEEAGEARDADHVHRRPEPLGIEGDGGQGHVAPVAAAVRGHA